MIKLENIRKRYGSHEIFSDLRLEIPQSTSIALEGRSGSGKTTLLNILNGLDANFDGSCLIGTTDLGKASEKERARLRREKIGLITQHFDLLDDRNVYENIILSISHQRLPRHVKREKAARVLQYVGLENYEKRSIKQLSGGEMQRVAIARAIIKDVKLIIADEPTGALDEDMRNQILDLFKQMIQDGFQFIIVTHDSDVSKICHQKYQLRNGRLIPADLNL